ncbi:MAG: metallophosphoesterase family protein [Deltaproteobacteria bacterium]|nr:metallophosphoesterase family protein [Deltaproteobacteria bacterium]
MKRIRLVLMIVVAMVMHGPLARATTWVYLQQGSALSYRPGTSAPPSDWTSVGFQEDASWTESSQGFGIGYGDGDDRTVLSDMSGNYLTVYVRAHFHVGSESPTSLKLQMSFDDGFVAYLNGIEVGRSHVPNGSIGPDDAASSHEVTDGDEVFDVDPRLLQAGDNVFAVEAHNTDVSSSDLSCLPVLWGYDSPPVSAQIVYGPFLQQVGRHSSLVVWETDQAAPTTLIYGADPDVLDQTVSATDETLHHVAKLDGLSGDSVYHYQVQSAKWPSQVARIQTEKDRSEAVRVGVYGDNRSDSDAHRQVVEGLISASVDFAFDTGDLVADGSNADLWKTFFQIEGDFLRDVCLYPILGNHEGQGDLYLDIFDLPENSPAPERYYTVRYGVSLFVVLDLYGSDVGTGSAQVNWLQQTLSDAQSDSDVRHVFVFLHHGPYDSGAHGPNTEAQDVLVPFFEQYGVDIVFSGHDHDYERSTVQGVKYVVTGGGGAPLYTVDGDWWTEVSESVYHYCILDIAGPRVDFTAKRVDGSVLDQFSLGTDASECSSASDCDGGTHGDCPASEEGAWACVQGGCLWNCHDPSANQQEDGGMDGGLEDGTAPADGATLSDGGPSTVDASGSEEHGSSGGCGCRAGSDSGLPSGLAWIVALLFVGWLRRSRSRIRS